MQVLSNSAICFLHIITFYFNLLYSLCVYIVSDSFLNFDVELVSRLGLNPTYLLHIVSACIYIKNPYIVYSSHTEKLDGS